MHGSGARAAGLASLLLLAAACAVGREGTVSKEDRLRAERLTVAAETLFQAGKPEEALAKVRSALARDPLHPGARLLAAKILVRLDRPEEGKAMLLHLPDPASTTLRRTCLAEAARITLEDLGQPSLAVRELEQALPRVGEEAGLLLLLGRAQAAAGREEGARKTLERALDAGADPRAAALLLAQVLFTLGEPEAAAAVMHEHVPVEDLTPKEKVFLGMLLCASGKTGEGLRLFREVQREARPPVEAYYDAGVALEGIGELAAAEENYRNALAAAPGHAPSAWRLGRLLVNEGRREEGLALLNKALALEKDPLVKQALRESRDLLAGSGEDGGNRKDRGKGPGD